MIESADHCLEVFDQFDLSDDTEKRLATRALVDFYGIYVSKIGSQYLLFDQQDKEQTLYVQWNKTRRRLRTANICEIPDEYNATIQRLWDTRNQVAHDYHHRPEKSRLVDAREIAEEWKDWLISNSEVYYESEKELSLKETISNLTVDALRAALCPPETHDIQDVQQSQRELNKDVRRLVEYSFQYYISEDQPYTVQKRDRNALLESIESQGLEQQLENISEYDFHDYHRAKKLRETAERLKRKNISRLEEEFALEISDCPDRCLVVDSYEGESDIIHLLMLRSLGENHHFWQDVQETPPEALSQLENLGEFVPFDCVVRINQFGEHQVTRVLS